MWRTLAPLLAALCACGSPPTAATLELAGEARHACAGWTGAEPMCASPLTLFEDRDATRPIAVITHPGYLAIDWSMPEDAVDRAEARVVLLGFELSGWAPLAERRFSLRTGHTLVPSVLRVPAGSPVRIVGRDGLGLRVELASAFRAPSVVRATIACDDLGPPMGRDASSTGARLGALRDRLAVSDAPRAPTAIGVELFPDAFLTLLEEREGWAHVVGPETGDPSLVLDGWVEASSITRDVEVWSESGCDPADDSDSCPDALVTRTTSVDVGPEPGVPSRLRIRAETEVSVVDRRDGYFAVQPSMTGLAPPEGSRFWIPEDAISPCADEDVGCSCP